MRKSIQQIAQEREEQIYKHLFSIDDDAINNQINQLSRAASALLLPDLDRHDSKFLNALCPQGWDAYIWHKMCKKSYKERLVIAGALIVAELDRLDYMSELEKKADDTEAKED